MKSTPNNTPENRLTGGLTEPQVQEAVRKSGYPLQTIIASSLRMDFSVQEEWSFIDSDSGTLRTLDVLASRRMFELRNEGQPFVRPTSDLLIECKQSDLPFVFFMSASKPWLRTFPYFAGLAYDGVAIKTDDDRSTWHESILGALGLTQDCFIISDVDCCTSLSKCVRKGKEIKLSGNEAFQSIALPLVKAIRFFKKQEEPSKTARYFDLHIPLAIAVVDAPMIVARIENNVNLLHLTPWVRVVRREAVEAEHWTDRERIFGIDVVHKSFFDRYLQQHAIPFAQKIAPLAIKHHIELVSGEGFASGMGADLFTNIEGRLRPRK
jgi:hypothetical protein